MGMGVSKEAPYPQHKEGKMSTFTYLSPDAVAAIIAAAREGGEKIPMELNTEDFTALVLALEFAWRINLLPVEVIERIDGLLSGFAEILGVDMV